jgi:hypothetical protein
MISFHLTRFLLSFYRYEFDWPIGLASVSSDLFLTRPVDYIVSILTAMVLLGMRLSTINPPTKPAGMESRIWGRKEQEELT